MTAADESVRADPIQDLMFEVYAYAKLSDGFDSAEGDARLKQRSAMHGQAERIRSMLNKLTASDETQRDAVRYRWLRNQATGAQWEDAAEAETPERLDRAIDAAVGDRR